MINGSKPRKTSRNATEQSNKLRQRLSFFSFSAFCSFYESPDDGSWAWDESLWPVLGLFLAVAALEQECPTAAKGWAWPVAPAPTSEPRSGFPTADSTPAAEDEPAPADCVRTRRCTCSVRFVTGN